MSRPDNSESRIPEKERAQMPWWWTGAGEKPPIRTPDFFSEEEGGYTADEPGGHPLSQGNTADSEGDTAQLSDVDRTRLSRMADFLRQWLPSHWALEDFPGPVHLHATEKAVWIEYRDARMELKQQVARSRWWVPGDRRAAGRLLSELALGLREQYEVQRAEKGRSSGRGE